MRPHGRSGDHAAGGVYAAGHVHADHRGADATDRLDPLGDSAVRLALEAGAEQRVNDHRRIGAAGVRGRRVAPRIGRPAITFPGAPVEAQRWIAAEPCQVRARVSCELPWRRDAHDRHRPSGLAQQAGDHQPVAPVVALAAEHAHRPVGSEALDGPGDAFAGPLHQREPLHALRLDRPAVDCTHRLGVRQRREPVGQVVHDQRC